MISDSQYKIKVVFHLCKVYGILGIVVQKISQSYLKTKENLFLLDFLNNFKSLLTNHLSPILNVLMFLEPPQSNYSLYFTKVKPSFNVYGLKETFYLMEIGAALTVVNKSRVERGSSRDSPYPTPELALWPLALTKKEINVTPRAFETTSPVLGWGLLKPSMWKQKSESSNTVFSLCI